MKAYVDTIHKRTINDHKGNRKLWWTKVKVEGKKEPVQITGKTEEILYEKLYLFYAEKQTSLILQDLYKLIMPNLSGKRGNVSDKTKREYARFWNKYFANDPIAAKQVPHITQSEWQKLFAKIIEEGDLSEKEFGQVIIILNHIIKFCIAHGYLQHNPIELALSSETYSFRKEEDSPTIKTEGLTTEQTNKVLEWCNNQLKRTEIEPIYILTIMFNLIYGLRIGELKGVKWIDIDWDEKTIYIRRQHKPTFKMEQDETNDFIFTSLGEQDAEHRKGYEISKKLPLNKNAIDLLHQIQTLSLSDEYVFPLRRNTYSDKIVQAAAYAKGISAYMDKAKKIRNPILKDIHPHSLRASAGSALYIKTGDIKVVQWFMGHTNPAMTNRYLQGLDEFNTVKEAL